MLKHLLAVYNYTSFVTKAAIDSFGEYPSMAGLYDRILLLNVVNEFPVECIEDFEARDKYAEVMSQEQSEIPHLFDNNCNAGIEIRYVSAKEFADAIEMPKGKRDYLKRYFS